MVLYGLLSSNGAVTKNNSKQRTGSPWKKKIGDVINMRIQERKKWCGKWWNSKTKATDTLT